MNRVNRVNLLVAVLLAYIAAAFPAVARDLEVNWTVPTEYESGEALPAAEIAGYKIEYGTCSSTSPTPVFGTLQGSVSPSGAVTTYTIPSLPTGTYCVRMYTVATNTEVSAPTNVNVAVLTKGKPRGPKNVTARDKAAVVAF